MPPKETELPALLIYLREGGTFIKQKELLQKRIILQQPLAS